MLIKNACLKLILTQPNSIIWHVSSLAIKNVWISRARGVIIANRPLVEYAPLYKGSDNETVVQYDMKNAEGMGLIKFDFLGLKTLTMIQDSLHLIEKNPVKRSQQVICV